MQRLTTIAMTTITVGSLALATAYAGAQVPTQERTYRLTTVAGRALPAVVEEENGCREEILAATLTLETGGRWVLVSTEREVCGSSTEQEEEREAGTYTLDGAALRFARTDDDDDDEGASETDIEVDEMSSGMITGGELTVRLRDERTVLVFRS